MSDKLGARVEGKGGETIVLLHGFGGSHSTWTDIQPSLARQARVIAYDLPGHGRSLDFPGAGPATVAAKAVAADLTARGLERVHLVGHSMGGAIATLIAMRSPERVASLTLLAPGGFGPQINGDLLKRYANAPDAGALGLIMDEMSAPGFSTPPKYVLGLAAVRGQRGQRANLDAFHGIIQKDGVQGEIPREALAKLAMPVNLVWGTADPVLPFSQTENLPENIRLTTIDGAGHMLTVEAKSAVLAAIRASLIAGSP